MKKLENLSEIYNQYDAFIIDLWGVVHNGIRLNPGATEVIEKLNDKDKEIIFLSNAPRPSASVVKFLEKLQMEKKYDMYQSRFNGTQGLKGRVLRW